MPMKEHVCPAADCVKSFHTEKGVEHHMRRNHPQEGSA